ncbi:T9SS type A sorting domain-containing protein [candidate division KSB1 bacterium]|nr:T9SS type A sorting domain-containing protein [candidate division KSB1 bacterium]
MQKLVIVLFLVLPWTGSALLAETGIGESASGYLTSLPPSAPLLHAPAPAAVELPDTVQLVWSAIAHAASYTLQVSEAADFTVLVRHTTDLTDTCHTLRNLAENRTYFWRVLGVNVAGEGDFSAGRHFITAGSVGIEHGAKVIPQHYALWPVFPNPANPLARITFDLPETADLSLRVYNSMGQSVRELASGPHPEGSHTLLWDGRDDRGRTVTSGLYLCRLQTNGRVFTQKILLMR